MNSGHRTILLAVVLAALAGCAPSTKAVMETSQSAVALRSFQQRAFDTTDKEQTLRTIIATLQDLSFVVDKADLELGSVSGTKLSGYQLRISVTARPRGATQMLVRANAQYMDMAVEDPKPYQDFFNALEKAMFLTAHQVD
jgi:Ni,Fe-hydrogenase III small subunit